MTKKNILTERKWWVINARLIRKNSRNWRANHFAAYGNLRKRMRDKALMFT